MQNCQAVQLMSNIWETVEAFDEFETDQLSVTMTSHTINYSSTSKHSK